MRESFSARDSTDTEQIAAFYNKSFTDYELSWGPYFHYGIFTRASQDFVAAQENTLRVVATSSRVAKESRVLDVGCGAGAGALFLAREYDCSVIGVDPATTLIDAARERSTQFREKLEFKAGSAEELPLRSDSIDAALSMEVFCHVKNKRKALKEVARVLKPGGCLALTDLYDDVNDSETEIFHSELQDLTPMPSWSQYHSLLRSSAALRLVMYRDYTEQLERSYRAATATLVKNRDSFVSLNSREEFERLLAFYDFSRSLAAQKKIGWFFALLEKAL